MGSLGRQRAVGQRGGELPGGQAGQCCRMQRLALAEQIMMGRDEAGAVGRGDALLAVHRGNACHRAEDGARFSRRRIDQHIRPIPNLAERGINGPH